MALVVIVLQDAGPGAVDMNVHCEPRIDLGPVDRASDTAAVRIGRRLVLAAKMTAARNNNTQPQED